MNHILRHIELLRDSVPDWKAYPFTIPAIAHLDRIELHPEVTFLVGENGSGKSTLIEAIAIKAGFNPEGGSKNFSSTHRPSESALHNHLRLARGTLREKSGFFLRAETMFNVSAPPHGHRGRRGGLHEGRSFMIDKAYRFDVAGAHLDAFLSMLLLSTLEAMR